MTLRPLFLLVLLLTLAMATESCKVSKAASKPNKNNDVGSFKDDISSFRPVYTVNNEAKAADATSKVPDNKPIAKGKPTGDITQKLNVILDTIAVTNKTIRYAQGYRVQIYSGTSSVDANKARDRSYALFPDIIPHIVYIQPNFRVKVGDFIDRLEAQRVFVALQTEFPSALIVPEKIEIR